MPKVSIIVPVYNVEKYIIECINSVLNQTFTDIELILVNDGSIDSSGAICDEFVLKDDRIKVFHQKNGGVCVARNKGLKVAKGDYIMFLDADDYLPLDAIETLYNDAFQNNADLAVGKMFSDSESTQIDDNIEIWTDNQGLIKGLEDHPALYGCCSKLFKRKLIDDIRFVEGKKAHEDGYFTFSALIKLPTITVRNKCTYIYRYNPDSASHAAFSDKYFDVLYFDNLKRQIIKEKFPELIDKSYNELVKAHITMLHLFCTTKDKKYDKDIKKSIKTVREYSKYFIPAVKGEKKFFLIVKYGGYWLFRRLYWLKFRKAMK